MLKVELEAALAKSQAENERIKKIVKEVAEQAVEENCEEALPYVADLNKQLNLGMTKDCYITLDIDVPIDLLDGLHNGVSVSDIKLTVEGKDVPVTVFVEFAEN